jgi:ATP-dependent DNA ligase
MFKPALLLNSTDLVVPPFDYILQPKLDGIRCYIRYINNKVKLFSRNGKPIHIVYLEEQFNIIFKNKKYRSIIFDGELYKHKTPLQDIYSMSRNPNTKLQYHIFDCYDTLNPSYTFYQRRNILLSLKLKLVPSHIVTNSNIKKLYSIYKSFEGIILRKVNAPYYIGKRSPNIIKIKRLQDSEFKLISYTTGINRNKDFPIPIFETKNSVQFKSTFRLSLKEGCELLDKFKTNFSKYKNKRYTIKYLSLSNRGVPLQSFVLL